MPRKRGHINRGKKCGPGRGEGQQSAGPGRGSHPMQNVHSSVHNVHSHDTDSVQEDNKELAFQSLEEMFRETLDADVIHMVLVECDWKGLSCFFVWKTGSGYIMI
jgi:hypothetical protein